MPAPHASLVLAALLGLALSGALAAPAAAQDRKALRQACHEDLARYCSDVMPGGGRIIACMQGHATQLTPACSDAIRTARTHQGAG